MAIVESVKQESREPYATVCGELGVPHSSLMRWRSHQQAGTAVVGQPGPAKVKPLDLEKLHAEILGHGSAVRAASQPDLTAGPSRPGGGHPS
jgi:hypothetical protein